MKKKIKPKTQRLYFWSFSLIVCGLATILVLTAFRNNIVFFKTPADLLEKPYYNKQLRLGGLVEKGSLHEFGDLNYEFKVTDYKASIKVKYKGMLPTLFREGQGVVAEGKLDEDKIFIASKVLAKHDEKYMPKEVYEEIRKNTDKNAPLQNEIEKKDTE